MRINSVNFFGKEIVKLFLWDNGVLIEVGSLDHFLEDIVISQLSQVFSDFSQIFESDVS